MLRRSLRSSTSRNNVEREIKPQLRRRPVETERADGIVSKMDNLSIERPNVETVQSLPETSEEKPILRRSTRTITRTHRDFFKSEPTTSGQQKRVAVDVLENDGPKIMKLQMVIHPYSLRRESGQLQRVSEEVKPDIRKSLRLQMRAQLDGKKASSTAPREPLRTIPAKTVSKKM
ncbi:unnamed protein product [Caenorhabditis auriculariae]|uniref:Uncharacterized protein n=1 Tax=Caenorhabditis auriculariae TaxID=2777116 RepID=A0A8S1HEA7_9PELO|nr:unnamed protein product [Caenorhabditis auriculariae]